MAEKLRKRLEHDEGEEEAASEDDPGPEAPTAPSARSGCPAVPGSPPIPTVRSAPDPWLPPQDSLTVRHQLPVAAGGAFGEDGAERFPARPAVLPVPGALRTVVLVRSWA